MASRTCSSRPAHGSVLAVLVLALAALSSSPHCPGAAAAAESGGPNWHAVSIRSLLPSAVCTPAKAASNSSILSVVHRHGPCSPLQSRGSPPSPAEILERDQERVHAIHRKITGASHASNKGVSVPASSGFSLGSGNYITSLGLGTPARYLYVEIDTGSDLSWVQCKPCEDCYPQQDPLFDPAQSSTFSSVHCGAKVCRDLTSSHTCSSDNKCRYKYVYADHSHTNGRLVRDTLTMGPSHDKIPKFVFGCGDDDKGTFAETDGLFGLGRAKFSFASQVKSKYGPGFSYCLPSTSSATGYLSIGAASTLPANTKFTAMVTRNDTPSFYYVDLVGLKVAGRKVKIPSSAFKKTGTILDSGTVFSRLPPRAYAALQSAFTRAMARYNYTRAPALPYLDTCYDFTGHTKNVRIPAVTLVFADGMELSLGPRGLLFVASVAQTCLSIGPIEDDYVGILGNAQQKMFAVVYDVVNKRIGFGANGCG